ncbi:hypothetical protein Micbo1qcDRAFT_195974 [Microdochium bolleyi]|uniref:IDI-2 n=1 Tax=Microdochium bolleyi TaxID=196109 RepID=A0A136J041_9PEZI|nr:hypothetical protein Micbo1qcDRAFT_195974 [Microdochium bolleyi]
MKTSTVLQSLVVLAFSGLAAANPLDQCGAAGVNNVDIASLPEGVDPTDIRKCIEHPLGEARTAIGIAASCPAISSHGCHEGYCWKQCGDSGSNQWCWTAANSGRGDWIRCSSSSQCNTGMSCGVGSNCGSCGCGC